MDEIRDGTVIWAGYCHGYACWNKVAETDQTEFQARQQRPEKIARADGISARIYREAENLTSFPGLCEAEAEAEARGEAIGTSPELRPRHGQPSQPNYT